MHWKTPREAVLLLIKIVLALTGAIIVTATAMAILPIDDFSQRTLGRAIQIIVFYSTWAILLFQLLSDNITFVR